MAAIQKTTPEVGVEAGALAPFIAYYRVSTQKQGLSGLGLEAQQAAVAAYVHQQDGTLIQSFTEVESGKRDDRPALAQALSACRAMKAVLVIAKLDRLARNAEFLLRIVRESGDGGVVFCDLPKLPPGPVGKFIVQLLAGVAELEAGLISARTRAALQAAKARGVKLGNPRLKPGTKEMTVLANEFQSARADARAKDVLPYIERARKAGATSLAEIATALNNLGVKAPRGGRWLPTSVSRVIARAEARPVTLPLAA
jgi:DNA invertase Pin-like site-specific DNA recombinase